MPGNETRKEILFVREADARREHWNGPQPDARGGLRRERDPDRDDDEPVRAVHRPACSRSAPRRGSPTEYARYFQALSRRARQARAAPRPGVRSVVASRGRSRGFASKLRERFFGFTVQDVAPILAELRQIKTAYEQDVLRRSVEISSDAHRAGMRAARAGKYEYEVEAAIEEVYLRNGAMSWGYPSIVGSGPNATILHYEKSSRRMEPGDLLLVDAAANYQGLTGDITRTYPVDGKFTREQRDIYDIVFAAQQAGEKAAKIGGQARDIQAACDEVLRAGLVRLGLVTDPAGTQFKIWATHGVTHWIGMDVHDVGVPRRPLEAGMAFTIEPGIYIREAALNDLPKTPENAAFIEKVRPMVHEVQEPRRADRGFVSADVRGARAACRSPCREASTKSRGS